MSTSELDRFSADLRADQQLQESFGIKANLDVLVKLANEKGYDFTLEEMIQRVEEKQSEQLGDEELGKVAGGKAHLHFWQENSVELNRWFFL